jgi:hypothetical protein
LKNVGSLWRHQHRLGLLSKNHKKKRLSKTTMSTLQSIPETAFTLDALRIVAAEYDAAVADLVDKCQWNSNDDIQEYLHPARKRVELAQKVWRTSFDLAQSGATAETIQTTAEHINTVETMAYSSFSLKDIEKTFGVSARYHGLFPSLSSIAPSEKLQEALRLPVGLPSRSEKFKSEAIVFPIIVEVWERNRSMFTFYSGDTLTADPEQGLSGECDFIFAKDTGSLVISTPAVQLVEVKKDGIESWLGQCAAQMLGAKIYNENNGTPLETIYGCVTTGDDWLFLRLTGNELFVDTRKYYLGQIGELLAAFQHILDYYKAIL